MQKSLRISPAPFKPSRLSIPPSPFSPRSPFTPAVPQRDQSQHINQQSLTANNKTTVHTPPTPLRWTWTCHQCHNSYGLSVTRRCLEDGHYYCSGPTPLKAWRISNHARRTRKRGACTSEFDYSGWKEWSRWRRGAPRDEAALRNDSPVDNEDKALKQKNKDCWNMCDYPSECRWGKKFGIHTPIQSCFPVSETNFMPTAHATVKTTSEGTVQREKYREVKTSNKDKTLSFWTALLVSAEKRKNSSIRASSPLSAITEEDIATRRNSSTQSPPQESENCMTVDGTDTVTSSDSGALQPSSNSTASTVGVPLKPLLSRRRYRRGSSSTMHDKKKTKPTRDVSKSNSDHQVTLSAPEALRDWAPLTRMSNRQACFV